MNAPLTAAAETTWAGELVPESKLPPQLVRMYASYAFDEIDRRGAFAYDTISEWAETTNALMSDAWALTEDLEPALRAQEREMISAMGVCWRLKGQGTLLAHHDLTVDNPEQADVLRTHLRSTGLRYADAIENMASGQLREWYNASTVKVAKGKGAPYWLPGTDPFAAVALGRLAHSAKSVSELNRMVLEAGSAEMPICQTAYVRIQSSGRLQPDRRLIGGIIHEVGERRGPKTRKIAAQPFFYNVLWAGVGGVLKELLKRVTERNTGDIRVTQRNVEFYKYSLAIDLKGFDDTVSIQTLDTYRDLVLKPVLDALTRRGIMPPTLRNMLIELDYITQRLPILLPPWAKGWGASLVRTEGGISSGERLTAQKGSDINRCRIDAKFEMLGVKGVSTNQGDDTIINSDDKNIERWMQYPEWAGFKEEQAVDISFLMKRMPFGYSYLGRMLMSSINKEASRESPNVIAAASALAIRRDLLNGHPLASQFLPMLERAGTSRIRMAVALARQHSHVELLNKAFALPASEAQTEEMTEDIERLLERLDPEDDRTRTLESMNASVGARFQMRNDVFMRTIQEVSIREASRYIRSKSYTRR